MTSGSARSVGERFPGLRSLEEQVERAKLNQALAEAQAATSAAQRPQLDSAAPSDAVSLSDQTTGLAKVLTQGATVLVADDIAEIVLDAASRRVDRSAGTRAYSFFISTDAAVLNGADVLTALRAQLDALSAHVDAYCGAGPIVPKPPPGEELVPPPAPSPAAPALVGPAVGAAAGVVQAVGYVAKLLQRSYVMSGQEVDVADMGIDLTVAHRLRLNAHDSERVIIDIDRLTRTADAPIINRVLFLARRADSVLAAALAAAEANAAKAAAEFDRITSELGAFDAQILELIKQLGGRDNADRTAVSDALGMLRSGRGQGSDMLPGAAAAMAAAQSRLDDGTALRNSIEMFLTATCNPAAGGRPPLLTAARAEALTSADGSGTYLLYIRPVAGGLDRTIETKLGPDRWVTLAGAAAEYCCISATGEIVATGVRSALQAASAKLHDPASFSQEAVGYTPYKRQT